MVAKVVMFAVLSLVMAFASAGCSEEKPRRKGGNTTPVAEKVSPEIAAFRKEVEAFMARPEHDEAEVKVHHILVAFKGTGTGKAENRTKEEAEALAAEIYNRAKAGEDFDALDKKYTNDSHPGVYTMITSGTPNHAAKIFLRTEMVPAFGNAGWRLQPGEIGVAPFDPTQSKYGWHIVMRLR